MLKYILLNFVFLFCFVTVVSAQDQVKWMSVEEAQQKNFSLEKSLIVDFTAVWCGWCKKMDATTFSDQKVVNVLNNEFYPVKMDLESGQVFSFDGKDYTAKSFAKKMGVTGLPTMVVVSSDLKSFYPIVGYRKPKGFLGELKGQ